MQRRPEPNWSPENLARIEEIAEGFHDFLAFVRSLPNSDRRLSDMTTPDVEAAVEGLSLHAALRVHHNLGLQSVRARNTSRSRKPGGDATGAQRKAARRVNVDYVAALVAWDAGGRRMEDFQQDRVTCQTKHNKEHVMRGADLADFQGLHSDVVRHVRNFKPAKSKRRDIGWDNPRTREPDPAMSSHKRHNDWLRELRDLHGYPAARATN